MFCGSDVQPLVTSFDPSFKIVSTWSSLSTSHNYLLLFKLGLRGGGGREGVCAESKRQDRGTINKLA